MKHAATTLLVGWVAALAVSATVGWRIERPVVSLDHGIGGEG